ncbi:MAG: hypothetical protein Tsb005_20010 [Gammaproteobacteria bacterium]
MIALFNLKDRQMVKALNSRPALIEDCLRSLPNYDASKYYRGVKKLKQKNDYFVLTIEVADDYRSQPCKMVINIPQASLYNWLEQVTAANTLEQMYQSMWLAA